MKCTVIGSCKGVINKDAVDIVKCEVIEALRGISANGVEVFNVNPEIYYGLTASKTGRKTLKPRVMNSADFLSKKLGRELQRRGWHAGNTEMKIRDQKIDGFKEFDLRIEFHSIDLKNYYSVLTEISKHPDFEIEESKYISDWIYFSYIVGSSPQPEKYEEILKKFFSKTLHRKIRVGLEFETGNIASSFRALSKINYLYSNGEIDFGVFITSFDKKNVATKIWPTSNRNGSFEELNKRQYKDQLTVPLLEIGFEPDKFSEEFEFLASDGTTYMPEETDIVKEFDGIKYCLCRYKNLEIWKRINL